MTALPAPPAPVEPAATGPGPDHPGPRAGALLLRLGAAAAGGFALWSAFPRLGWWPLAFVGVALSTLAARGVRPRTGALLGFVTGLCFFFPHISWTGIYVGFVPWAALAVLESLFFALMGALLPLVWRVPGRALGTVPAVGGLWVAQEALRGREPFGGFPWGRLAFSQSDSPVLGLASLGGAPLMSFAVGAGGAALALLLLAVATRRTKAAALAAVGVVLAGSAGLAVPAASGESGQVRVAGVQGNVPQAGLEFNAERRAVLDNHANTTLALAARIAAGTAEQPDLVVWPENSSDIDPLRNPDAYQVIQQAVDAVGVPTMVGAVLREPVDQLSNATLVWGPTGSAAAGPGERYVKQHPAPFAEYIPYRSFFRKFSSKVDLVTKDFVHGDRTGLLQVGPATVSDVICFEVAYDDIVSDPVRRGADLIVVQTNNATFGRTPESVQQLAMSKVRAVENGRSVIHVSTVGVSGIILPDGTLEQRTGHFTRQVMEATVPLRTDLTPATRAGAWPETGLAALGLGLIGAAALSAGRTRREQEVTA